MPYWMAEMATCYYCLRGYNMVLCFDLYIVTDGQMLLLLDSVLSISL